MKKTNNTTRRELIANRLKEARILAGLSQKEVAQYLNIQRPAIAEIEAGRRKVSAEEIILFAEQYKVSSSWLLNSEEKTLEEFKDLRFAARELGKLKPEEMEKIMKVVKMLK